MAFRGHYDYSLDAKNRLNIPPRFRAAFSGGVLLARDPDPCVAIWAPDSFERYTESIIARLGPASSDRRKVTRFFAGGSFDTELDSAGRVTLNAPLLEHAGLSKEVVVVGNFDRVEVWDRERWTADQGNLEEIVEMAEAVAHPS